MTHGDTNLLFDLVARKCDCLAQLRDLAVRQWHFIERDEMHALMQALGAKQQMLGRLQDLDRRLAPFRGEDAEGRPWPTVERRQQCRDLLARCESLLAETLQWERQGEVLLRERRDLAAARLAEATAAVEARDAYAVDIPRDPPRLDLCSER